MSAYRFALDVLGFLLGPLLGFLLGPLLGFLLGRWSRRPTPEQRLDRVRAVFTHHPGLRLYGPEAAALAGLPCGSVYVELLQLEQDGTCSSGWTDSAGAWPRRRWYQLAEHARSQP